MKNKIFKISFSILTAITILQTKVHATSFVEKARAFITRGNANNASVIDQGSVISEIIPFGKVLVEAATIVLVVVGLIMGVKYMMAGIDEKAKMKEKLIWYVISIVLVFGAVGIFNIVSGILSSIQ